MTKQDIINLKPHSLMELNMMEWKKLMDVIKTAHSLRAQAATADFNEGEKVMWMGARGKKMYGTVHSVNRTTVTVDTEYKGSFGVPQRWRVGTSLLTKI